MVGEWKCTRHSLPGIPGGCCACFPPMLLAQYRHEFWKLTRQAHRSGQLETLLGVGLVCYHLIEFAREALRGHQNASFYSARRLDA
jgi:hypothetical protein